MLRTVETVIGTTPSGFASPPSPVNPSRSEEEILATANMGVGRRFALMDRAGRHVVGVIDMFDSARRRFGGFTIVKSSRQGPYPAVYQSGDGELDMVDDDGAMWVVGADSPSESGSDSGESFDPTDVPLPSEWPEPPEWDLVASTGAETVEPDDSQHALDDFKAAGTEYRVSPRPCAAGDIRSCDCCLCPDCHAQGVRRRKNKSPTFACGNPRCETEGFSNPVQETPEILR